MSEENVDLNEDEKEKRISFFREVSLILIGGFLGLTGSFVNAFLESEAWEKRTKFELNQSIVDKKIHLLERTAQILNKKDYINLHYALEIEISSNTEIRKLGKISEHRKIISELNSEFMTVISLNNIYFGNKSKESFKQISDRINTSMQWWQVDKKLHEDYMNALFYELGDDVVKK